LTSDDQFDRIPFLQCLAQNWGKLFWSGATDFGVVGNSKQNLKPYISFEHSSKTYRSVVNLSPGPAKNTEDGRADV